MNFIETSPTSTRFALILNGLCGAVAARIAPGIAGWAMQAVMIVAVWTRIRRVEGKLQELLARFLAGRLRVMPPGRSATVRVPQKPTAKLPLAPTAKLPRRFAWLCVQVPYAAAGFASQLRVVLAEPEMVALLAASPQARRVLAPLLRMLGIEAEMLVPVVVPPVAPELIEAAGAAVSADWAVAVAAGCTRPPEPGCDQDFGLRRCRSP